MTTARVFLALACAAALAGCTSHATGGSDAPLAPPSIGALPTASAGASLGLPIRAYAGSNEEIVTLSKAEGLLTQDCMRRLGFGAWQPPAAPQLDDPTSTGLKIGITDPQRAAQYGYHDPKTLGVHRSDAPATAQQRAELAALSGLNVSANLPGKQVPEGGCTGEADRKIKDGEPAHDVNLYGALTDQADQATAADSRVTAALAAWSACMRTAGQNYQTPWDASGQTWAAAPTQAELALATTDVDCKRKTNLAAVWLAVLTGYQNEVIEHNKAGLDAIRAAIDFELNRAKSVLAGQH